MLLGSRYRVVLFARLPQRNRFALAEGHMVVKEIVTNLDRKRR
jgi:hypothetical protein